MFAFIILLHLASGFAYVFTFPSEKLVDKRIKPIEIDAQCIDFDFDTCSFGEDQILLTTKHISQDECQHLCKDADGECSSFIYDTSRGTCSFISQPLKHYLASCIRLESVITPSLAELIESNSPFKLCDVTFGFPSKVVEMNSLVKSKYNFKLESTSKKTLKILAVAGYTSAHGGRLDEVDYFNPYSETNNCKIKPNYPRKIEALCGVGNLYCGGDDGGEIDYDRKECYELVEDEWIERNGLWYGRSYSSCIALTNSSVWFFGGFGADLIIAAESSEMRINEDSEFGPSTRLPEGMCRTCVAKINDTHLFIAGNYYHHPRRAYIVDTSTDTFYFTRLPDMNEFRESAGCGSVDGEFLIVAGGFDHKIRNTSEIFSLTDNEWSDGPVLPRGFWSGGYISDSQHPLILVGGDDETSKYRQDAMEYMKETNTFEFLPGKLSRAKSQFAATGIYTEEEC